MKAISQKFCREIIRQHAELEKENEALRNLIEQLRNDSNTTAIDAFYETLNASANPPP